MRDTARVPIVLFADPQTGLDCDVSTHNPLALRNTELLRAYAKIDGRVRGMAYVIKKWAKIRGINSPSDGTLSSYGYILCVLAFLQTVPNPPILPSLQRLDLDWPNPKNPDRPPPERVPHPFDASRDVCLSFHDPDKTGSLADLREIAGRNRQSLGELLALFFRHYAWDVDYRNLVVAPRTACVLPEGEQSRTRLLAAEPPFGHRGPLRDALRRGPRPEVPEAPARAQGVHAGLEADRRRRGAARRPGPGAGLHLRAAARARPDYVSARIPKPRAPRRGLFNDMVFTTSTRS